MFMNCASVKWAMHIQKVVICGKFIAFVILIVIGLIEVGSGKDNFVSKPLHPNISIYIYLTVFYTFCKVLTRKICLTIKSFFSW